MNLLEKGEAMEELQENLEIKTCEDPRQGFSVGQLVFAKVKGYPAWPAKVLNVRMGSGCKYSVFFFGTQQTGVVKEDNLWLYNETNTARFSTEKVKKRPEFIKGINQMKKEESGWKDDNETRLKEVKVMLVNSEAAIRSWAKGSGNRDRVNSVSRARMGGVKVQLKKGENRKTRIKTRAIKKEKACELCSKRFSTTKEVSVHIAKEHLKDLRIDLSKQMKSSDIKGVARFFKGSKGVAIKGAQVTDTDVGDSEVTFKCIAEEDASDNESVEEVNSDTEEESLAEGSFEEDQEGEIVVNSGAAEFRKKILGLKLVDGQRHGVNCILPECCNCGEVLAGKVYMCQVGHKFCQSCLRKKKIESVDLTLTCSAHCNMDIIGRDKGIEAFIQNLMKRFI